MVPVSELYKYYEEHLYENVISGTLDAAVEFGTPKTFTPISLTEIGNDYLVCYIEDASFTIRLESALETEKIDLIKNSLLAFISLNGDKIKIAILDCRSISKFSTLDIAFGDDIISKRAETGKVEQVANYLKNDYVFDYNGKSLLIIETYTNKPNDFTIHGLYHTGRIVEKDGKWIVVSESGRKLSRNHHDFLKSSIAIYNNVKFKVESECFAAIEVIRHQETKGSTLLEMWRKYNAIELEKAQKYSAMWGTITFKNAQNLEGGITRIEVDSLEIPSREDLLNTSYEINEIKGRKGKNKAFKIVNVEGRRLYISDEDYQIEPGAGYMLLSTIGNEKVYDRREEAVEKIRDKGNALLTNLYLTIENSNYRISPQKSREYEITQRTRDFLKSEFDIDSLTQDQEEAIRIALNTPDIAIIQGPPGTGKTTVVSALCYRLMEIAEQENTNFDSKKLVLVSAFQNDTVEHIASKIRTLGLPTIKVGKDSASNAESEYAEKVEKGLKDILKKSNVDWSHSVLNELLMIHSSLQDAKIDISETKSRIQEIIDNYDLGTLKYDWTHAIYDNGEASANERYFAALRNISCDKEHFNYNTEEKNLSRIERASFIEKEEKEFIRSIRIQGKMGSPITVEQLQSIDALKRKYLNENSSSNECDERILNWLNEAITVMRSKEMEIVNNPDSFKATVVSDLMKDLKNQPNYIKDAIMVYSQGVAATNQYSARREVDYVENVVLEEAARSNPLDILIPMTKASKRIILVGDQEQLPHLLEKDVLLEATVSENETSRLEKEDIYKTSLFKKLQENVRNASDGIKRCCMLTKQFRMHSAIGNFISETYYDNKLESGREDQDRFKLHGLSSPKFSGKVNIFCNITEGKEDRRKSISRSSEVTAVFDLLEEIRNDDTFDPRLSIGIITFYSSQVKALLDEAEKRNYAEKQHGETVIKKEYFTQGKELIRIGSVDSFQGKEFDIVILSCVRSNELKIKKTEDENEEKKSALIKYGFLTLGNRLNVAFSRAQRLLIVVGDKRMFIDENASRHVKGLYNFCTKAIKDPIYGAEI